MTAGALKASNPVVTHLFLYTHPVEVPLCEAGTIKYRQLRTNSSQLALLSCTDSSAWRVYDTFKTEKIRSSTRLTSCLFQTVKLLAETTVLASSQFSFADSYAATHNPLENTATRSYLRVFFRRCTTLALFAFTWPVATILLVLF